MSQLPVFDYDGVLFSQTTSSPAGVTPFCSYIDSDSGNIHDPYALDSASVTWATSTGEHHIHGDSYRSGFPLPTISDATPLGLTIIGDKYSQHLADLSASPSFQNSVDTNPGQYSNWKNRYKRWWSEIRLFGTRPLLLLRNVKRP